MSEKLTERHDHAKQTKHPEKINASREKAEDLVTKEIRALDSNFWYEVSVDQRWNQSYHLTYKNIRLAYPLARKHALINIARLALPAIEHYGKKWGEFKVEDDMVLAVEKALFKPNKPVYSDPKYIGVLTWDETTTGKLRKKIINKETWLEDIDAGIKMHREIRNNFAMLFWAFLQEISGDAQKQNVLMAMARNN